MNEKDTKLRRYMETTPTPDRVERNWKTISAALPTPKPRRRWVPAFAFAIAAVALLVLLFRPRDLDRNAIDGAVLETAEGQSETLELADGTRLELGSSTRLLLVSVSARDVRLELQRGHLDLQVTHIEGRKFTLAAASSADVEVVGTRFHVDVRGVNDVEVGVTEGRVRIVRKDDPAHPRFLGAGETWVAKDPLPVASTSASAAPPMVVDAGHAQPPPRPHLPPKFVETYRDGRYLDAYSMVADDFDERCAQANADELFLLAEASLLSAHPASAATAFDALRKNYRTDKRAGLAALELGRLRLDELDAPSSAREALEDAIALDPNGNFREDAEARRVQALDAEGRRTDCIDARDRYLAAYPDGLHRVSVTRRCR
ncbi:hypothetical protein BH09MYX1_BH09MYX1_31820 [soil metagenome]